MRSPAGKGNGQEQLLTHLCDIPKQAERGVEEADGRLMRGEGSPGRDRRWWKLLYCDCNYVAVDICQNSWGCVYFIVC